MNQDNDIVSREVLYDKVWSIPASRLTKELGISNTLLREICHALRVPRPDRGYWAKLSHGKKVTQTPLPAELANSPIAYAKSRSYSWHQTRYIHSLPTVESAVPSQGISNKRQKKTHPLLNYAEESLSNCEKTDDFGYFRYRKNNLPYLLVGSSGLKRAVAFANRLFAEFENAGCSVRLRESSDNVHWYAYESIVSKQLESANTSNLREQGWINPRATLIWVGCVPFVITIFEQRSTQTVIKQDFKTYLKGTEPKSNTRWGFSYETTAHFVNGLLGVHITSGLRQEKRWELIQREEKPKALLAMATQIISQVIQQAPLEVTTHFEYLENQRLLEEQRKIDEEKRRIQRELERLQKQRIQAKENLANVIRDWSEVEQIHSFFDQLSDSISRCVEPEKSQLESKLGKAKELIGVRDPMDFFRKWSPPD